MRNLINAIRNEKDLYYRVMYIFLAISALIIMGLIICLIITVIDEPCEATEATETGFIPYVPTPTFILYG